MRLDQENKFLFTDRPKSGTNASGLAARALTPNRMWSMFLTNGGSMHRYITAFIVLLALAFAGEAHAQWIKTISGYLPAGQTNELFPRVPNNSALDTIYQIAGNYDVSGTLKIDEGSELEFLPNSRVLDSAGGKIVANGYTGLNRRILFRGLAVNANSHEWGHFVILPNSDSAYFANVRFVNFRKRNTVDVTPIYSPFSDPTRAAFNNAINADINGVGACIATFSHNTYIYDAIVDSCQASFAGGAFAFLQAPAGWPTPDDGRLALVGKQVGLLTIRDTRVYNNETTNPQSTTALGGAIYMSSNNAGYLQSDNLVCYLGYNGFVTGTPSNPVTFTPAQDLMLFERCTADNSFDNVVVGTHVDYAEGGAIYVGTNTALVLSQCTFNTDSAVQADDANAWGGAIAVNQYSGSPIQTNNGSLTDQMPGLSILKTATFRGNVAGVGGAIHIDMTPVNQIFTVPAARLIIDGEHIVPMPGFSVPVRDSGKIWFDGNIAYMEGGAIYSPNKVYITGYLAPNNFPWPGGSDSVELRVEFSNNVAAVGGGSIYLDAYSGGTPDLVERRAWHLDNSVNPFDPRLNPAGGVNRGTLYGMGVIGGGAEFVGLRDSTFATEFSHNFVVGGNGGAVNLEDGIASGNQVPINRYFAENEYNAQNVRIPRDTFASASIFPYDPRELTRFVGNRAELGPDSAALYSYNPVNPGNAHGRGGGLYIQITSDPNNVLTPLDSTFLSRVRFESDTAYSGSAIWCDRYDFKLMSNQSLIANNIATSPSSATVDLDTSGVTTGISNPSDPDAGAAIWADFEGPLPSYESNSRGDAIYDNTGRYILRLPVSTVIGKSGADTLRGNFWGETGPSVITEINPPTGAEQSTFFIDYYKSCFTNIYEPNSNPPVAYMPVTIGQIPDTLLLEGRVYDLFDRGTDMKVADYTNRRLAPAEAFSLGLPNSITTLHRFTRNIFDADPTYVNKIDLYQTDFQGPQPLGYPLFLQADVPLLDSNRDPYAKNYTVFMVFNQTTNEFVRVNLKESVTDEAAGASDQIYRGRLDFVPDSSVAERHPTLREQALYTLSLLRPTTMTYDEVQRASMLEDSAALKGREYQLSPTDIVAPGDTVFADGRSGGFQGKTTWYAGERYHTLPVRPGDHILVISRTQLWEFGPAYAITHGLQFTIGDVLPPSFVADVPILQSDVYNPNVKFIHEDVNYNGNNAPGNSQDSAVTLFRVAGYDPNYFYDPRFLFNQGNYTQVRISVTPDLFAGDSIPVGITYVAKNAADSVRAHVRLNHWMYDSIAFNQNITGSNGYVVLKGQPHNPDVVPGGEGVTATLTNYPPNFASEDSLLMSIPGSQLGPDSSALSMWLFPPSMNCARVSPDNLGANPDTLDVRSSSASYHFRIVVMDSLPVFKPLQTGTTSKCGYQYAILTDSLRYKLDLTTDDEIEDSIAAAETLPGAKVSDSNRRFPAWDFRYGRTAYDFQTEPSWMTNPSGGQYVTLDSATDPSFKVRGIINVRLDSTTAVNNYLLPNPQVNGELNLDTIVGVEANDGHTGKTLVRWPIEILFAPTILNTSLPNAAEDTDYSFNFQYPDQIRRILIQNLNPDHYYTYTLIYKGTTDYLFRDIPDSIPMADSTVLVNGVPTLVVRPSHIGTPDTVVGHTPSWLKIDPFTGVLTGTPTAADAPRAAGIPCGGDTVDVLVSDGTCVQTWAEFPLTVDSINHAPFFVKGPKQPCVTSGVAFCDSAFVVDRDLLRDSCAAEMLTVTSSDVTYNGVSVGTITVTPGTITGPLSSDTTKLAVCGTVTLPDNYWNTSPLSPLYIQLKVVDADGAFDTISYPFYVGQAPSFECSIWVSNAVTLPLHPLQDIQKLCFGAGEFGTDSLDYQYCEVENAPAPPTSAFDARWILPVGGQLEGSTIDIRSNANPNALITWQVQFQPGNEGGAAGSLYPVDICWNSSCLDTTKLQAPFTAGHFYLRNPRNSQEFSIDMSSGVGPVDPSLYTLTKLGSDSMCLQIRDQGLTNALIVFIPNSVAGVGGVSNPVFALEPNYPNPFASTTTLNFSVAQRSDVRIDIYDVKGTLVRTLVNEPLDPGSYPVTWDGTDESGAAMPQGNYVAHMSAGSYNATVKMSLEKGAQ